MYDMRCKIRSPICVERLHDHLYQVEVAEGQLQVPVRRNPCHLEHGGAGIAELGLRQREIRQKIILIMHMIRLALSPGVVGVAWVITEAHPERGHRVSGSQEFCDHLKLVRVFRQVSSSTAHSEDLLDGGQRKDTGPLKGARECPKLGRR